MAAERGGDEAAVVPKELADKRSDVKKALSSERKLFDLRRQDWRGQDI
jgi:hypothetical protein